jgi:hypothetical protein
LKGREGQGSKDKQQRRGKKSMRERVLLSEGRNTATHREREYRVREGVAELLVIMHYAAVS